MLGISHEIEEVSEDHSVMISESKNVTKGTILHLHGLPGGDMEQYKDLHKLFAPRGYRIVTFNYPGLWRADGNFTISNSIDSTMQVMEFIEKNYEGNKLIFAESFGGFIAVRILQDLEGWSHIFYRAPLPGLKYFTNNQQKMQQLLSSMALLVQSGVISIGSGDLDDILQDKYDGTDFSSMVRQLQQKQVQQYVVIGKNDEILDAQAVSEGYTGADKVEVFEHLSHNNITREQWIEIITRADIFYQS